MHESESEEEEALRLAQERRMEEQESARIEVAEAEFCSSERIAREQNWARQARSETCLSWRQLAEHEVASANVELEELQERRREQQEDVSRRFADFNGLALETALLDRHAFKAHQSERALDAEKSLQEAQGRVRLGQEHNAEQETVRQEDLRREAMARRVAAQEEAAAELASGIEVERVREFGMLKLHVAAEEGRRQRSYDQYEPILHNAQLGEENELWEKHCRSLNEESELLRQHSLRLRAETERTEQAALESALHKLIVRQMEQQRLIAEKGEKERRKQWTQLQAINATLGSSRLTQARRKTLPSSEVLTGAWDAQLSKEEEKGESLRQALRTMGLDKADYEQLRHEQRSRVAILAKSEARLAASLSYSRERWLEDAAFLRDIFLRSTRVSTLRKYVDEQGRPHVAGPKTGEISKKAAADRDEGWSSSDVNVWTSATLSRVALLREYVLEAQEVCQAWGLHSTDNTLLPSISQLHVRVEILGALARAQRNMTYNSMPNVTQGQGVGAAGRDLHHSRSPPTGDAVPARVVDGSQDVADDITYVEAAPGAISQQERERMEEQVQECEGDAAELRAHVLLMRKHVQELRNEASRAERQ